MLKVGDKVYLHVKELDVAIEKLGFNTARLCIIDKIETVQQGKEELGLYKLTNIDGSYNFSVMSNDKLWKMATASELAEVIKKSKRYDETTKEDLLKIILE